MDNESEWPEHLEDDAEEEIPEARSPPPTSARSLNRQNTLENFEAERRTSVLRSAMAGLSTEETEKACAEPDPETKDYIFQQTMYRIKDPKVSLDFYTRIMGMRLLKKLDFPEMKFSLYFMGYESSEDVPEDETERTRWTFSRKATLELTHNWGTENDTDLKYHSGNSEPRGYGHIGIMVPDVESASQRFEELGVKFVKKPNDGKMKGIAFIQDPDGYWIEILNCDTMAQGF